MKNKYKTISIILVMLLVLTVTIGLSYAYYVAFVSNVGNNIKTNITTNDLKDLVFSGETSINNTNMIPGEKSSITFSVDNPNNVRVCFTLNWSNVVNSFVNQKDLIVTLVDSSGNEIIKEEDNKVFAKTSNEEVDLISISSNTKETYTLTVTYKETEEDQSGDMGKEFSGTLSGILKECPTNLNEYITLIAKTEDSLVYDETSDNNLRYIGSNPNNYISVEGELWRIIGVMNNIDDGTGKKETRVKLIRDESIGNYSWDTSDSSVNSGYGVNGWSQADIMKLLNPSYESEEIGGSLYWNNKSGHCYKGSNNGNVVCDFTNTGIKETLKFLIGTAIWNLGGIRDYSSENNGKSINWYNAERGTLVNKNNQLQWLGNVGLLYVSDYGYATSGGSNYNRVKCLNKEMFNWNQYSDCYENNWLYSKYSNKWAITPHPTLEDSAAFISKDGNVRNNNKTSYNPAIKPVVYLKSSVKILSGDGSSTVPYVLGI